MRVFGIYRVSHAVSFMRQRTRKYAIINDPETRLRTMFLSDELHTLIQNLCKLPGIGPRSARRMALHLVKHRDTALRTLCHHLTHVADTHRECHICGYLDARDPCFFCTSPHRTGESLCIVAETGDVWAFEKAAFFKGRYHVLGGLISAFCGRRPEDLNTDTLRDRLTLDVKEIILAMDGTLEGQTTLHYLTQKLEQWAPHARVSSLARGLPVGGELDYLDQGTLMSAFLGRRQVEPPQQSFQQWVKAPAS